MTIRDLIKYRLDSDSAPNYIGYIFTNPRGIEYLLLKNLHQNIIKTFGIYDAGIYFIDFKLEHHTTKLEQKLK